MTKSDTLLLHAEWVEHYMMCCLFLPQKHQDSEKHKIIAGKWMPNTYKKFDD
jgi:hypothetical protein